MARKQTYAAAMKQLSKKKAQYEQGLDEANRTSNRSGIRDYERRLAKLNSGMDELFQAQESAKAPTSPKMMYGGKTRYEDGGDTDPIQPVQQVPMHKRFTAQQYKDFLEFKKKFGGQRPEPSWYESMMGMEGKDVMEWDRMTNLIENAKASGVNPANGWDGIKSSQDGIYGKSDSITQPGQVVEDNGFTTADYRRYEQLRKNRNTKAITSPKDMEFINSMLPKLQAAQASNIDPARGYDGIPRETTETRRRRELEASNSARIADEIASEPGGANPYQDFINDRSFSAVPYDGTEGAYHHGGMMFVGADANRQPTTLTEEMLQDGTNLGVNTMLRNEQEGKYGRRSRSGTNSMVGGYSVPGAGVSSTNLSETTPTPTPTPSPTPPPTGGGKDPGPNPSPPVVNFREYMTPLDPLGPQRIMNTAKGDAYYPGGIQRNILGGPEDVPEGAIPTKTTGLQDFLRGNNKGGERGSANTNGMLGMAAGIGAQMLPYMQNLRGIKNLEGPAAMPQMRAQTMNTDLQVGNALAATRNEAARQMASIDANVSNPVVAAAMKRANQRVAAGQQANILSNEATQELGLRNQNINQLTNTINQNAQIGFQNEQRNIDFRNERAGARNQVYQNMGATLGQGFSEFQQRAADLKKFELLSKLDEYGVIGRNNIDGLTTGQ